MFHAHGVLFCADCSRLSLWVSDAVYVHVAVHHGVDGECRHALDAQLFHYVLAVGYHRCQPYVEAVGDFLVYVSAHYEGHHFRLALGEQAVPAPLHGRQVAPAGVCALLQCQQLAHELPFGLAHAYGVEARHLRLGRGRWCEHYRLVAVGGKVCAVLQEHVQGHEVVEMLLRSVGRQFGERAKCVDLHHRHHFLQQCLEAECGRGVGVYDGYARAFVVGGVHVFVPVLPVWVRLRVCLFSRFRLVACKVTSNKADGQANRWRMGCVYENMVQLMLSVVANMQSWQSGGCLCGVSGCKTCRFVSRNGAFCTAKQAVPERKTARFATR